MTSVDIFENAKKAGYEAIEGMEHPFGCGFAWVNFGKTRGRNKEFIKDMLNAGIASRKRERGTYSELRKDHTASYIYWVGLGIQSIVVKEAFAEAMANYLSEHGVACYVGSRLD